MDDMDMACGFGILGDAWHLPDFPGLAEWLEKVYNLEYEMKGCLRGVHTKCYTGDETLDYLRQLRDELDNSIKKCEDY